MVTIATFSESLDAHLARSHLDRQGIPAVVVDELAASGTKLQVDEGSVERARQLLLSEVTSGQDLSEYWRCGQCDVIVDPGFDLCWSCLRPRGDVRDAMFSPTWSLVNETDESDASPLVFRRRSLADDASVSSATGNSRSVQLDGLTLESQPDHDERITRAWRASVLGLIVFPPLLNIYSMYLLVRACLAWPSFSRRSNRQFYAALIINIISGLALGLYRWLGLLG